MADFFERVLDLLPTHIDDDMWAFQLPDGGIAEMFRQSHNGHFTTGPVVEFPVEDVEAAAEELRAAGVPIVFGPEPSDDVGLHGSISGRPTATSTGSIQGWELQAPTLIGTITRGSALRVSGRRVIPTSVSDDSKN